MMAASLRSSVILTVCFVAALVAVSEVSASSGDYYEGSQLGFMLPIRSDCLGTVAECLGKEEDFELDSESSRRILAVTRYIGYGALQRNTIPCSRRGQSYYNCGPGAPANPYTRGCSAITRCRS